MAQRSASTFSWRALRGCMLLLSAALLPLTGLVLHVTREGHHGGPGPHLGQGTHLPWMEAHVALGIVFAVLAVWHLASNLKPLKRYTLRSVISHLPLSVELLVSAAIVGALVAVVMLVG